VNTLFDEAHHVFEWKTGEDFPGTKVFDEPNAVIQVVDVHCHVNFTINALILRDPGR